MLNLTRESARTSASRLVTNGILIRICRNLYVVAGRKYSIFSLANALFQPSIISLETALNYWGLIVQVPEALDRALKKFHYPDEQLSRSVVLMKELEDALRRGDLSGFSRRHALLVDQMKQGQAEVLGHARAMKDRSRAVPKEIMREMESVDLSTLPEGYRDLLREYYKILSRGGK